MNGGTACPSLTETGSCTPPSNGGGTPDITPPSNGGGTPDIIPCADANRNTAADGSCDTDCLTGYEFDDTNTCVAVSANGGNGGNGDDPFSCADNNRVHKEDDNCGECLSGYYEEFVGDVNCIPIEEEEEGTNWLLVGGGGAVVVALIAAMVLAPKTPIA